MAKGPTICARHLSDAAATIAATIVTIVVVVTIVATIVTIVTRAAASIGNLKVESATTTAGERDDRHNEARRRSLDSPPHDKADKLRRVGAD